MTVLSSCLQLTNEQLAELGGKNSVMQILHGTSHKRKTKEKDIQDKTKEKDKSKDKDSAIVEVGIVQ